MPAPGKLHKVGILHLPVYMPWLTTTAGAGFSADTPWGMNNSPLISRPREVSRRRPLTAMRPSPVWIMARKISRATNDPYLPGLINAMIITLISCSNMLTWM